MRRVALMALMAFGEVGEELIALAMEDPDADVRRLAVVAMGRESPVERDIQPLIRALSDASARVRVEAVKSYAARAPDSQECPVLFGASDDVDLHVAIAALDLLARPCENRARQNELLSGLAATIAGADSLGWHRPLTHSWHSLRSLPESQRHRGLRRAAPLRVRAGLCCSGGRSGR